MLTIEITSPIEARRGPTLPLRPIPGQNGAIDVEWVAGHRDGPRIAPCFELWEAVVAVNDVKRPSQFGQERDCLFPFRSERQARAAMPEVACKL